ncbi:MAG TPA: cytochrome c biogenesis protein CcsA [Chitinophagaceae bacterium]|nr:cytochrome c biogenesis protein CcsA [Chitinophagaceae bacterium]
MDYIGEHLLPGQLGHLAILVSLVASLVAAFAYFNAARTPAGSDQESWIRLARGAFLADALGVFTTVALLIYINFNHLFEYKYAWQHSSLALEAKYLLACVWEGQEGSFLLWTTWHCVLGLLLIRSARRWEAPVMTVISFAQFVLATMIVGFYLFGERIGSNPFALLRNESAGPIFSRPDYLTFIKDGNDLNPLLQNYWMVIHPPVLFMGFASTIVPFAFAFAGLWKRDLGDWTRPALPWALFSAAVLGLGVMMGGMWAYESLTFGGYWAWDPVENASMVPWLTLVAGIHTLLIFKHTGRALRATHLLFICAFGLVLYSTFLTRTGILGDTSVHAFTGEGNSLFYHLLLFMALFLIPAFWLFARNYRKIPTVVLEENTSSREFWMFIGSLVLFLAGLVIIGKTSVPVVNKMFGTNIAAPEDPEFAYNRVQIYVAIIIGVLTAMTQYLKYRQTSRSFLWKKLWLPTLVSLVAGTLIVAFGNIHYDKYGPGFLAAIWVAIVSSVYAAVANLGYIWIGLKGKLRLAGGSITHLGFALMLVGILISSSKKEVLSYNTSGIFFNFGQGSKEDPGENLTLIKGVPMEMGRYLVTYVGDSTHPKKPLWYYKIHFKSRDGNEEFTLMPNAFVNYKGNEGLMANPDSKHYWDHDVFTYITSLPDPEKNKDTASFRPSTIRVGDTIFYSRGYMLLQDLRTRDSLPSDLFAPGDAVYDATVKIFSKNGNTYVAHPKLALTRGTSLPVPDTVAAESLVLQLAKVDGRQVEVGVKESSALMQYVTLKAYKFPFIRVLWLGVVVMVAGFLVSVSRRNELNRLTREAENLEFSKQQNA